MGNNTDKRVEFYDKLRNSPSGTMDINGVVLGYETSSNWHVCKSGNTSKFNEDVRCACSSTGPSNPFHKPGYVKAGEDSLSRQSFKRETELLTPREYMEKGSLCSHCERMVKNSFGLERVVMAVSQQERSGDIERFAKRRDEVVGPM